MSLDDIARNAKYANPEHKHTKLCGAPSVVQSDPRPCSGSWSGRRSKSFIVLFGTPICTYAEDWGPLAPSDLQSCGGFPSEAPSQTFHMPGSSNVSDEGSTRRVDGVNDLRRNRTTEIGLRDDERALDVYATSKLL